MISEIKYRRDIQVLRGLAVLAVVLFHAKESYFPLGFLGVDVFFVISGYVVTPLILQIFTDQTNWGGRLSSLRYFYKRRFYRLAPALAVTLTISAISIFLLGSIDDHERFARQGIATLLLVGNVGAYNYSGDYFSPNPNPLIHTWSLSVEEQIYIFLPLILMLILHNRASLKRLIAAVLGFISAISFISFLFPTILQPIYSRAEIEIASQFSFYSPIDRIWQFTVGGIAFLMLDRYKNRANIIPKSIDVLTVIAVVMILFGPRLMSLKVCSFLASLFAVIIILSKSLDVLPNILTEKLEWLGDRSYSIYLIHMPLIYIAKNSLVTQIGSSERRIIQSIMAVVVSILLGALSYSKIENRFRNNGKNRTIGVKALSTSLILTIVTPLVLFVSMDRGVKNQYWGLDRNTLRPPSYISNLEPKCLRDLKLGRPCIYPNLGATKTVLLIGDSHASQISQALVDATKKTDWNAALWPIPGCTTQLTVSKQALDKCISNQMKKWVEENKPTAIIISLFIRSNYSQSNLKNQLSELQSINPNILLIENVPIFPDEKDFMVRRPLIMSPYKPPKVFIQSMMQTKHKNVSNQLANWAKKKGMLTINFDSIFCNQEICTRWSGAEWLYRDWNHLSNAGAALTIPQLINFLKRF